MKKTRRKPTLPNKPSSRNDDWKERGYCQPSGGKYQFRRRGEARTFLRRIQSQLGGTEFDGIYRCEHCNSYHLASHGRQRHA